MYEDYDWHKERRHFSTVFFDNKVFQFGGDVNTKKKNEVHFYDGIKWMINRMGQLLAWRTGHRSLVDGRRIIHVGGNYMNKVRLSKDIKGPIERN